MHPFDWFVLLGTLGFIVGFGVWKTKKTNTSEGFLRGGSDNRWWGVGLSVMATQASAITFLSTPGQGYLDGMRFIQFYFGLPLAMLVIGFVFIPLYYKWKVYTAYEFIGKRFDKRTRLLTAGLFLLQRSLAAGITIYAPSIILSKILGWPLSWTCVFIGGLVILYTTTGGARAVGVTQKQQMAVMFLGIFTAFGLVVHYLGDTLSFTESIQLAGSLDRMTIVDTTWDPAERYTLWSGLIGGFFLQLSYFGTDQSQVQRYLSGQSIQQARQGLWMNGILKIPMQFFILLTGVLVFVFYMVQPAPLHWNETNMNALRESPAAANVQELERQHDSNNRVMQEQTVAWAEAVRSNDAAAQGQAFLEIERSIEQDRLLRNETTILIKSELPAHEPNDKDYIFVSFIMNHLPIGIIGLLLAMIFSAGMSSTAAELSALATTSTVDVFPAPREDALQVRMTRLATAFFGVLALLFAAVFSLFDNLIQAVNILGSLFYGTILGIFLVAFFIRKVQGTAVFIAAVISQFLILLHYALDHYNIFAVMEGGVVVSDPIEISFLWYNLIGPAIVVGLSLLFQSIIPSSRTTSA
jgi:solute:Na+ symporter, SSS family